jgi:hypothetical protein
MNRIIHEFTNSIQVIPNGTDAEMYNPSENPELTNGAERENVTHQAVDKILQQMAGLPEVAKPAANHLTDFDVPHFASKDQNDTCLQNPPQNYFYQPDQALISAINRI